MRMSSGPAAFVENPRWGVSSCMEDTPEVRQDAVGAGQPFGGQRLRQAGEVRPARAEHPLAEAERAQPRLGPGQFQRIDIEAEQESARQQARDQLARMAAVAERAVHGRAARARAEDVEDLLDHDRHVGAGRRLPGGQHLRDRLRVLRGRVLLVLLAEPAGMLPGIPRTTTVGSGTVRRSQLVTRGFRRSAPRWSFPSGRW